MSNVIGYKLKNDKQGSLQDFYEKYVDGRWVDNFLKIDEKYKDNKEKIEADIVQKFDDICKITSTLQISKLKGNIKYIYFSFLRTNIIEDKADYRIDFFDENWFLDKVECSININLDFVFDFLFSHMEELKVRANEYGRSVTLMDIEEIKIIESEKYNILAIEFLSDIINKLIEIPAYKEMEKSEDILIMAGEYMDRTDVIYPIQEENKES